MSLSLFDLNQSKANNVLASSSETGLMSSADKIKLDSLNNYIHPATHDASIIVQSPDYRFVSDIEKNTWNNKLDASVYTAADVLNKIKIADGTGSGLDADLLDGNEGSYFTNFNNLTNKPTTLSGYGITDAVKSGSVATIGATSDGTNANTYDFTYGLTIVGPNTSNMPVISSWWQVFCVKIDTNSMTLFATLVSEAPYATTYLRTKVNGEWRNWTRIIAGDGDGSSIELSSGYDLNNLTRVGFYHGNNLTNMPPTSYMWAHIIVHAHTGSSWIVQDAIDLHDAGKRWTRHKDDTGTWSAWEKIYTQSTITYGTADPTGGTDGDIYFKYT